MNTEAVKILQKNIALLTQNSHKEYQYIPQHDKPLPSLAKLQEIVELFRAIVFPGYFGDVVISANTLEFHLGVNIERLYGLLKEQIHNGLCFNSTEQKCADSKEYASELALTLINKIPELKRLLSTDVKATFDGDPAAQSYGEVIFCYPTIRAVF